MAENILVVDDDVLMHGNIAHVLERVGHLPSSAQSAPARAAILDYPPEVVFLTARRYKLDGVLGLARGAEDDMIEPLHPNATRARVRAAAARPALAGPWERMLPAAFLVGILLLVLAAPQWVGLAQAISNAELPSEETVYSSITDLVTDPAATFSSIWNSVQAWLDPGGRIDGVGTLGLVVLGLASAGGLARLLVAEGKHKP